MVLKGDVEKSIPLVQKLQNTGTNRHEIVIDGIEKALESFNTKCTIEEYNLLEIMLVGRAVMSVIKYLSPTVKSSLTKINTNIP